MPTEGEFRNRLGNAAAGGSPGANLMGFNPPYAKNTTKGKNAKNSMNTTRKNRRSTGRKSRKSKSRHN